MLIFLTLLNLIQLQVPLKPSSEFEIKLDYQIKLRGREEQNTYSAEGNQAPQPSVPLPFLTINFRIIKAEAEVKFRVNSSTDSNILTKKVLIGAVYPIDIGFTDDIKDGVKDGNYTITLFDEKRNPHSKVLIRIERDGNFFVNNELRGKL